MAAAVLFAGTLKSGFDPAAFDRSVTPQEDLYSYVNGAWLKQTAMPGDRVTYGAFTELSDKTEADLQAVIEDVIARPNRPRGSPLQQIADLYLSATNEARLEELGASPIEPELRRIDAAQSASDIAAEAGHLSSIGVGGPFAGTTGLDPMTAGRTIARISPGGTLLPDRDYYVRDDAPFRDVRVKYEAYLRRLFELTSREKPAEDARDVLAFETAIARLQWPDSPGADARVTLRQLPTDMPGFDWTAWAKPQGIDRAPAVIFAEAPFFREFAALVPQVPLPTLKAWLASRYITAAAPFLSRAFDTARFDFFGTVLTGQQRPRARNRRGVTMVSGYLGDAIGKLYVERHFSSAARQRVQAILANVVEAYRGALRESDWLSPVAKREALEKLSALSTGVGYPERWRDYRALVVKPDDLAGNWLRALTFEGQYRLSNPAGTAGGEWVMPPQTVNAYYSAAMNEITLPAAVLQPPVFDVDADDAVNYGAAGSLIGHEIGHAFDDRGRRFDGAGNVRDWWTPADAERFAERTAALVRQLNLYEPLPGIHVNGSLTAAETAADLGGLTIALRAYKLSLKGKPAPVLDGLTGEQRFFLGWARMWRAKDRDEYLRATLQTTAYLPGRLRAHASATNIDGFFDVFGVKPGNRLYRAPVDRVRIW
jgi:predicted metalloendopeptidase